MTRLLVITNLFPLPWEPARGVFNLQQVEYLARTHEVQVWVPVAWHVWLKKRGWRHRSSQVSENVQVVLFPYFYVPGILRVTYGISMFFSLLLCFLFNPGFRPDRILATWLYPDATAAAWLSYLVGVPCVLKAHGTDVNKQCQHPSRALQVRLAARIADAVYCVSNDLCRQLHKRHIAAGKLSRIYNGVDLDQFRLISRDDARVRAGLACEGKVLLYVGNLKREKGVFDLLEAFRLSREHQDADLVFIGDGPDRTELERQVSDDALTDRVTLVGAVPHEKLGDWMAAANALVLPSYAEGVPNVVLEAMACGTPVVATDVGGIPEVLPREAGILVPAGERECLADACCRILSEPMDRQAIRRHAETFSWTENIHHLEHLWQTAETSGAGND